MFLVTVLYQLNCIFVFISVPFSVSEMAYFYVLLCQRMSTGWYNGAVVAVSGWMKVIHVWWCSTVSRLFHLTTALSSLR